MAAPPESRRYQEDTTGNTGLPSSPFASSSRSPRLDGPATVYSGHRASASEGFLPALNPKSTAYDSDPMRRAGSLDVASSPSRRGNEIELLLGEDGRGKSTGQRTATPPRSSGALGSEHTSGWTNPWSASASAEARPSTPQSRLNDDDTTPRGAAAAVGVAATTRVRESSLEGPLSSASRPLHTPPQVLPRSSSFNYSPSRSPSASRFADPSSSSPSRRPTSTHSTSSISDASSVYSEEDNSWAAIGLPTGSSPPRSPIFAETLRQMSQSAQSRPLSEFDFAAAYAATGDDPASPSMPTVGMVQPASPVVHGDSTSQGPSENGGATTGETEAEAEPLQIPFKPAYEQDSLPKPPFSVLPSAPLLALETPLPPSPGLTAPSPTPSDLSARLHPAENPPSRASSPSTPLRPPSRSSNRSPAGPPRPPRRNRSNLNLAQSHADSASSDVAVSPGPASASAVTHGTSPASANPASEDPTPSNSTSTSSSFAALSPIRSRTSLVLNGSPRSSPPSIPEKSRRRASTLRKGLSSPTGRRESIELVAIDGQGLGGLEMDSMETHSPEDDSKSDSAPLSVSDFADAYGHTDFDAQSESDYPDSKSHIRDAASFGQSSLHAPSSEPMQVRTLSVESSSKEDVFLDAPTSRAASALGRTSMDADVERPPSRTSTDAGRSETPKGEVPKGDAKARAAAFIADLKRARAAAARGEGAASAEPAAGGADEVVPSPRSPASPSVIISPVEEEAPTLPDVFGLHRPPSAAPFAAASSPTTPSSPPLPRAPTKRTSQSSMKTQSRPPYSPRSRSTTSSSLPLLSAPLLRRRPLPLAIQASGELKTARTAGERARIYAKKINELAREKSRLDEWLASVREVNSAIGRVTSPTSSPVKQNRAFRQDGSTATFAPRGDGYRAKEIPSHSFTLKDVVSPSAPYPGVLGLGKPPSTSASASAAPGRSSFFSLGRGSLGRRASKREPPSSSSPPGSVRSTASISAPSPLIYSSSASTTTASSNLRPLGGPRMPNNLPGSRASFDSRVSSPSSSPVMAGQVQLQPAASANPHRASFSYGSTAAAYSSAYSPGTAGAYSSAYSPAIAGAADVVDDAREKDKLERLGDILPQATREGLVQALRAADGDEVLAISVYLSSEVAQKR